MQLNWTHDKDYGTLKCIITEDLVYIAYQGGKSIHKFYMAEHTVLDHSPHQDPWEDEKKWLSDNFSNIVGTYEPFYLDDSQQDDWIEEHDWKEAFPMFGISQTGTYLDRLQRPSEVQTGALLYTTVKFDLENKLCIEKDADNNYFKREWCEELNTFYNVQPCCVFPDNPGLTPLSKEEAEELLNVI